MQLTESFSPAITPRNLIGLSLALLLAAGVFGLLNAHKAKTLRLAVADAEAARDAAMHHRMAQPKEVKGGEVGAAATESKAANQGADAGKEAEFVRIQKEKTDLQATLQAKETEIAALQKRVEDASARPPEVNPGTPSATELQAQLDEARQLLDGAEKEKSFLTDKIRTVQDRTTEIREETKRRETSNAARLGVRGTVLAVNQAYNFVVLNLGGRQGVEANSEMLVVRGGSLIGKIRISSVEPSTAIGDIITSSLARGVQVQPGDIVIYAGSNS
jgi:hypothetical protein